MSDSVHGLKRALSVSVCTVKLDNWTALAALGSKARRHQLCLAQTQTTAKATKHIWCLQRWRDTSGTWLSVDKKKLWFQRSPPWHLKVIYLASDILCGILSDMLSGIFSEILSGILSVIKSGMLSAILSGIFSDVLCDILPAILSGLSSHILSGLVCGILSGKLSDILSGKLSILCCRAQRSEAHRVVSGSGSANRD